MNICVIQNPIEYYKCILQYYKSMCIVEISEKICRTDKYVKIHLRHLINALRITTNGLTDPGVSIRLLLDRISDKCRSR